MVIISMRINNNVSTQSLDKIRQMYIANLQNNTGLNQSLQNKTDGKYDILELNSNTLSGTNNLMTPQDLTYTKPENIEIKTLDAAIKNVDNALEKADKLNLSFGDRLSFLKREGENWVSDIQRNDPKMFVQWLKMNKDNIASGRADLAHLSSSFTMEDYYSYIPHEKQA